MSTWRIMKARGAEFDRGIPTTVFQQVGSIETDRLYLPPSAQQLGEAWGEGEFLCLRDDGSSYERVTVVQDAPIYKTADVTPLPEAA